MFAEVGVPVLGLVENMSGFVCPECGHTSHPFGHGGAEAEAAAMQVPFLGRIPLDIGIRTDADAGTPGQGAAAEAFLPVALRVAATLGL